MIVSSHFLSYFVDIEHLSISQICETLNDIGIEVEQCNRLQISKNVVVGKVLEKVPHPNADKLNICQVDIGEKTLQIVCGAKNVAKDQFVALALEGAKLPSKNENEAFLTIKQSTLRGVQSYGMICSSSELGLSVINDGIMVLDSSIGELVLGKELSDYAFFNQHLIEVSLTPNRGDCLCVLGIARELASVHNLMVKTPKEKEYGIALGIGRAINLSAECHIKSRLLYKVVQIDSIENALQEQIMLSYNGLLSDNALENHKRFAMYMSGVMFDIYPLPEQAQTPTALKVRQDEKGFECVFDALGNKLCVIGVKNYAKPLESYPSLAIIQASFAPPEMLAKALFAHNIEQDPITTYRSVRGSNTELLMGASLLCELLNTYAQCSVYSGYQELDMTEESEQCLITMDFHTIPQAIGKDVQKEEIAQVLKQLNFHIEASGDGAFLHITPPPYRHDIASAQDITEEFLRIYGIKNIQPLPYKSAQKSNVTPTLLAYQNTRAIAKSALTLGFYECIHYVFYQRSKLLEWGCEVLESKLDLQNPITSELDTLRTSLIPALFESASRNHNLGFKSIKLFEIGSVYSAKREERKELGIVVSGLKTKEAYPYPKGEKWDFYSFAKEVSAIIGDFTLVKTLTPPKNAHPHICADIMQNGKAVGIIAKLHPSFEKSLDLHDAFYAQIYTLQTHALDSAKPYPKLHANIRDITIIIDKCTPFHTIQEAIKALEVEDLEAIYPLDVYEDTQFALTIRLVFRAQEKSLTEEELAGRIQLVLACLEQKFSAKLKA